MIKYLTVPYMLMHGLKNLKVFKVLGQTAVVKQAIAKQVPMAAMATKKEQMAIHCRQF